MPGLVAGIHDSPKQQDVDGRDKHGHDENAAAAGAGNSPEQPVPIMALRIKQTPR